ncbi:MAG: holo-ACP synthase [bacterium]|nr:holo-ACP synthase [bacterium]
MLGIGSDIVEVARIRLAIERHGDRFLQRCFRPDEIALAARRGAQGAATLASRWAAKEAFVKALGATGPIAYRDIEVVHRDGGPATLRLHGLAAAALRERGGGNVLLSLSHEREIALAVVVLD